MAEGAAHWVFQGALSVEAFSLYWSGTVKQLQCAPGNAGHTLITAAYARRLGLLDAAGRPKQAWQRKTTVHGVVANATDSIYLMTLTYELRGEDSNPMVVLTWLACWYECLIWRFRQYYHTQREQKNNILAQAKMAKAPARRQAHDRHCWGDRG